MAQYIAVERLKSLIDKAASEGAAFAWLDPDLGLAFGDGLQAPMFAVDIGREVLIAFGRASDAEGANLTPTRNLGSGVGRETDLGPPADPVPPSVVWPAIRPGRHTGDYVLTLEGRRFAASSQKQLLLVGLQEIERARPGSLERLSGDKARTKRVVGRDRSTLNDDPKLAVKFSERIDDGWWVFTNNSYAETEKFVRRAAFHAGLHVRIERLS